MTDELLRRLNAHPEDEANWFAVGHALIEEGDMGALRNLFNARHRSGRNAIVFAFALFQRDLTARGLRSQYPKIAAYPLDCPFSAASVTALGYASALLFELEDAARLIRDGWRRMGMLAAVAPSETLDLFEARGLATNVTLMESPAWKPAASVATPSVAMIGPQDWPEAAIACAAFCDPVYLRHYGRDFVAGITAALGDGGLALLGVLDPDDAAGETIARLQQDHPRARFLAVSYGGPKMPEMAAAIRFVLANELMERLGRPMILLDVDTLFRPGAGEALRAIAQFPLSFQNLRMLPPHLTVDACVVGAHPGETSRRFFDVAAEYVLGKLAQDAPLWMFDQVALHRAACLAGTGGTDLCSAFRGRWETDLPGFFKREHSVGDQARYAARTNVQFHGFRHAGDGGVEWVRHTPA